MDENIPNEALLTNYFIHNHKRWKDELLKPLKDDFGMYKDDMHPKMKSEMLQATAWILKTEICIKLKIGIDAVDEFIHTINLEELLK